MRGSNFVHDYREFKKTFAAEMAGWSWMISQAVVGVDGTGQNTFSVPSGRIPHSLFPLPAKVERDSEIWKAMFEGNFFLSSVVILFALRIPDDDRDRTSPVRFTSLDSAHLIRGEAGEEPHLATFR